VRALAASLPVLRRECNLRLSRSAACQRRSRPICDRWALRQPEARVRIPGEVALGVAISALHQKGGRNGFLAGSPDCHSSSDRDHGRCVRALSRVFVNGSNLSSPEVRPLPDAPLFARSRLRLPRSSRARDCQVTSPDDEYRVTDAHMVAAARAMRR